MRFKHIFLGLVAIFLLVSLFIYIEPSITGLIVQNRLLISDVSISADEFDKEVKIEQFDDYDIKFDNALYYFTADGEGDVKYVVFEFMVDNSQIRDYSRDEISLYRFDGEDWEEADVVFVKQDGRYYYYNAKTNGFGLFAAAPRKELAIETPVVDKNDVLLFAVLPIFVIVLLFSLLSFAFILLVQIINYRVYLLFKKLFFGLVKLGLSFGIVVLILDLVSPSTGEIGEISYVYYVIIPLVVLVLISDIFLNFVLWIHRKIEYTKVYRVFRNVFWMFVLILGGIFALLVKFIPKAEGVVTRLDLIIYGLLPLIFMSLSAVIVLSLFYVLIRRVVHTR